MFWLWTLLICWLLLFVGCYIVLEVGQNFFYDEVTPYAAPKVGLSSLAMAAALTWIEHSSDEAMSLGMFTSQIWFSALLAIAAFVLFTLVLRFHPPHALALGPATVLVVSFAALLAVESLANSGRSRMRDLPIPPSERTIRKSSGPVLPATAADAEEEPASP